MILSSLGLRERLVVRLAGVCGMRPGEIAGLCWRHIGEQSLRVEQRIYRGKLDTPKSDKGVRAVPLPQSVRDDSSNVYNKVGLERQLHAVQTLDNALQPAAQLAS